jgi:hypothetical protein
MKQAIIYLIFTAILCLPQGTDFVLFQGTLCWLDKNKLQNTLYA